MRTRHPILQLLRAGRLQLAAYALLWVACSRPEQNSAEPAKPSVEAPAQLAAAQPSETELPSSPAAKPAAAQPAAGQPPAAPTPPSTPIPEAERQLYDIIVRLVNEPASLPELAPKARFEDYTGKKAAKAALKDPVAQLGWLFSEQHAGQITKGMPTGEWPDTPIECDPAKLTCQASYGGGQTDFTFARQGDKIVLKLVEKSLID